MIMDRSSLGDRMKLYEAAHSLIYPARIPLMLRLDGVHFHTNVKRWKCEKPFDARLVDAMANTAKYLCEEITGAQIAYTQSDEITILVRDDMSSGTEAWHGKKINKILSIAAAKASNAFNYFYHNDRRITDIKYLAEFDCRGYVLPEYEIPNAFIWRQQDYTRNSVQMLARAHFSHGELQNKNNSEVQDMLMLEKKINWNDLPVHLKRGICVVKNEKPITVPVRDDEGKVIDPEITEVVYRRKWEIDKDIPIFTTDRDYLAR
jgi:tRNA(His) guanylyltransferase